MEFDVCDRLFLAVDINNQSHNKSGIRDITLLSCYFDFIII